mmetsp:Transcript_21383/g.47366  ORF Transcript_21383/g.47366 Transcript_21383/m.47366 type:complete len:273 (-) Transcript_21383:94-912(-)
MLAHVQNVEEDLILKGVQRAVKPPSAEENGLHHLAEVLGEVAVNLWVPQLVAHAVLEAAHKLAVFPPGDSPHATPAKGLVAEVSEARQNSEHGVLICHVATLIVINDGVVAAELGVHINPASLPWSHDDGRCEGQLTVAPHGGWMLPLIEERPGVLVVLLALKTAGRGPHCEWAKLPAHRYGLDLHEVQRDPQIRLPAATHVEHHAAKRMVLVISHVYGKTFMHEVIGHLGSSEHSRDELLLRIRVAEPRTHPMSTLDALGKGPGALAGNGL